MKKIILIIMMLAVLAMPGLVRADAYGLDTAAGNGATIPKTVAGSATIPEIIGKVVGAGLSMLGVVFFLLVLYAGFLWMTAMGDKGKIDRAKEIMEAAAIGLMIVLASYAIATFVFSNIATGSSSATSTASTASGVVGADVTGCCHFPEQGPGEGIDGALQSACGGQGIWTPGECVGNMGCCKFPGQGIGEGAQTMKASCGGEGVWTSGSC